ncbi:hypothetical protein [Nonomuraea sp. 10N515B]|uniref:hypothetical protein n=1 Tax=Nonomuraea sp. 10N515B TaxID=3457422 RepID=UPI003FCC2B38
MTAPTMRHRQQIAAAALANLLTHPVPDSFSWHINREGVIEAMPAVGPSLDVTRVILHQWAALLDDAQWSVKPHSETRRRLIVEGTWIGQKVRIWELIPIDGPDLAELSARPELDTVAGAQ